MPIRHPIDEAQRLGRFKSREETINEALKVYLAQQRQLELLKLQGQIDYDEDYDYKQLRKHP